MRISKYLAHAGIASRRKCEEYIREGRISVNGAVIDDLGHDVDPGNDSVLFDGRPVAPPSDTHVYIMFNKPLGCVSTASDDKGRKTVLDYIDTEKRIYPVGRLDFNSEGLLILTDDGDLAYRLTHPSHEVKKRYFVKCSGRLTDEDLNRLRHGVVIDGRKTAPAEVRVTSEIPSGTELTVSIHEGRNRQIRKMFEAIGRDVVFLKRISIGKISLGDLKSGKYRHLSPEEIRYLKSF